MGVLRFEKEKEVMGSGYRYVADQVVVASAGLKEGGAPGSITLRYGGFTESWDAFWESYHSPREFYWIGRNFKTLKDARASARKWAKNVGPKRKKSERRKPATSAAKPKSTVGALRRHMKRDA